MIIVPSMMKKAAQKSCLRSIIVNDSTTMAAMPMLNCERNMALSSSWVQNQNTNSR